MTTLLPLREKIKEIIRADIYESGGREVDVESRINELLSLIDTVVKEVIGDHENEEIFKGYPFEVSHYQTVVHNALRTEQQKRWEEIKGESL